MVVVVPEYGMAEGGCLIHIYMQDRAGRVESHCLGGRGGRADVRMRWWY